MSGYADEGIAAVVEELNRAHLILETENKKKCSLKGDGVDFLIDTLWESDGFCNGVGSLLLRDIDPDFSYRISVNLSLIGSKIPRRKRVVRVEPPGSFFFFRLPVGRYQLEFVARQQHWSLEKRQRRWSLSKFRLKIIGGKLRSWSQAFAACFRSLRTTSG